MRLLAVVSLLACACTTHGPVAMTQRELKARGTHVFDGAFDEVYDAAYLALERYEGKIATASRLEGVVENDKVEFTPPPGWDGVAYRSYAISVYQQGAQVAVTAVPRLWAGERDVSEEPWWVMGGHGSEEEHWQRLFDGIQELLTAWREIPDLTLDKPRGVVSVLGVQISVPADWRGLELSVDRKSAVAQATLRGPSGCPECPGGMNPSIVIEIARRQPPPDATKLEQTAIERALGPKLALPDAWDISDTPTGRRGVGQVVAGDPAKTVLVVWRVWDAREPAWMIRAAAACGAPEGPAGCEGQWDAMIDGVRTTPQ